MLFKCSSRVKWKLWSTVQVVLEPEVLVLSSLLFVLIMVIAGEGSAAAIPRVNRADLNQIRSQGSYEKIFDEGVRAFRHRRPGLARQSAFTHRKSKMVLLPGENCVRNGAGDCNRLLNANHKLANSKQFPAQPMILLIEDSSISSSDPALDSANTKPVTMEGTALIYNTEPYPECLHKDKEECQDATTPTTELKVSKHANWILIMKEETTSCHTPISTETLTCRDKDLPETYRTSNKSIDSEQYNSSCNSQSYENMMSQSSVYSIGTTESFLASIAREMCDILIGSFSATVESECNTNTYGTNNRKVNDMCDPTAGISQMSSSSDDCSRKHTSNSQSGLSISVDINNSEPAIDASTPPNVYIILVAPRNLKVTPNDYDPISVISEGTFGEQIVKSSTSRDIVVSTKETPWSSTVHKLNMTMRPRTLINKQQLPFGAPNNHSKESSTIGVKGSIPSTISSYMYTEPFTEYTTASNRDESSMHDTEKKPVMIPVNSIFKVQSSDGMVRLFTTTSTHSDEEKFEIDLQPATTHPVERYSLKQKLKHTSFSAETTTWYSFWQRGTVSYRKVRGHPRTSSRRKKSRRRPIAHLVPELVGKLRTNSKRKFRNIKSNGKQVKPYVVNKVLRGVI